MQQPSAITDTEPSPAGLARWADWFSPGRFAALLGLLVFATFPHVILGWQTFVIRDYGLFVEPLASFQRDCFWHGQLPFWNPYNNCGVPFLAQWNTMPLYPPVLLYLLLPLTWALSFFSLAHLWFAGLGMYWLARRWTGNDFGAAFAGLVFAFNGISLNLLMWPSHIATLSWMPWVIFCVEQAWREGGRKIPLAAFAGAMQMLAGGPETILFTWGLLALLWLLHLGANFRANPTAAWRFPLVVLLVAGIAAVQLLPFLELTAHSQREEGYADTRWSMPGRGWANFLVPMAFGHVANTGVFLQNTQQWTSSYYLGVGTLLLALLAVWLHARKKLPLPAMSNSVVWLLIIVATIALVCSFGDQTFFYRALRQLVPQLSFMTYPIKYVTVVVFIAPILAALALAHVTGQPDGNKPSIQGPVTGLVVMMLALIAVILIWAQHSPLPGDNVELTLFNGASRVVILLTFGGLLIALGRNSQAPGRRWMPLLLVLIAWLDVLTHEPAQNPTVSPEVYQHGLARLKLAMQPQPALGGSRAMLSPTAEDAFLHVATPLPGNFLVKRVGYFANCNLLDDVPKVDGFFSLYPRECGELFSAFYASTNALDCAGLLDFMGVSQITAPGQFAQWQPRDTTLPLVTAGQRPVFLDDTNALPAILQPNFDSRQVVFLPDGAQTFVSVTNQTRARVLDSHFTNERVDATVEADAPSLVVIAQTYYEPWHAYVDDKAVPLLRANYAFQALQVPTGRHEVCLIYEDHAFKVGGIISALSVLCCAMNLAFSSNRRVNKAVT